MVVSCCLLHRSHLQLPASRQREHRPVLHVSGSQGDPSSFLFPQLVLFRSSGKSSIRLDLNSLEEVHSLLNEFLSLLTFLFRDSFHSHTNVIIGDSWLDSFASPATLVPLSGRFSLLITSPRGPSVARSLPPPSRFRRLAGIGAREQVGETVSFSLRRVWEGEACDAWGRDVRSLAGHPSAGPADLRGEGTGCVGGGGVESGDKGGYVVCGDEGGVRGDKGVGGVEGSIEGSIENVIGVGSSCVEGLIGVGGGKDVGSCDVKSIISIGDGKDIISGNEIIITNKDTISTCRTKFISRTRSIECTIRSSLAKSVAAYRDGTTVAGDKSFVFAGLVTTLFAGACPLFRIESIILTAQNACLANQSVLSSSPVQTDA